MERSGAMIRQWLSMLRVSLAPTATVNAAEKPADGEKPADEPWRWPAWLLFVACVILVLVGPGSLIHRANPSFRFSRPLLPLSVLGEIFDWLVTLRWPLAFLVSVPFFLSMIAAEKLTRRRDGNDSRYVLDIGHRPPSPEKPKLGSYDPARDAARWARIMAAAETTWNYERDRYIDSLERLRLNALVFGDVATVALTCCVVVLTVDPAEQSWGLGPEVIRHLMTSVATAAATAFLVKFASVLVRISSRDISSRMFAWAARSLALVVIADVGLFILFGNEVTTNDRAIVLGLFVGATGDHAIQLLLEKAAALFKTTSSPPAGPSPLLSIEGMTTEHVNRLEEEGILSIHDLAFVPTARLFFMTAYSLQQICNWQDRALLSVYVGAPGARALDQHMKILGAIDLRACARRILYQAGGHEDAKKILSSALSLAEGGLPELLHSMAYDEVTMRVWLYWRSAVTNHALPARVAVDPEWVLETE
jgi:hypothetical protein